jgi:Domain of unknown function (DUF6249)
MGWVADALVPISPFVMIIFVYWFISLVHRAKERHRAELQKDLMAKFTSAQEISEFMKTDAGKLLLPTPDRKRTPAARAGTGTFVIIVGLGLFAASLFSAEVEVHSGLRIAGLLAIAAGIGFLISAIVTQKLSQKWGEEEGNPK